MITLPSGRTIATLSVTLLFLGLAACGSDDSPTTPTPPGPPAPTRVVKANPSLANDIQEIFNRRGCSSGNCHGNTPPAAGLSLATANASFAGLVNTQASQEPIIRVIPNDADNSYLVIKLEGRQSAGSPMPLGGTQLDTIDMNNIKNWINTGALNN